MYTACAFYMALQVLYMHILSTWRIICPGDLAAGRLLCLKLEGHGSAIAIVGGGGVVVVIIPGKDQAHFYTPLSLCL
jgi:hypothetical protein